MRHLIVVGAMVALLMSMAIGAQAQVPPEGCYLAPDGETFVDDVTGEVCVQDDDDDRDDDDDDDDRGAAPVVRTASPSRLAATGTTMDTGAVLAVGLGLLVLGGGALGVTRRRQE